MKEHLPKVCAIFAIIFIVAAAVFHWAWLFPGIIFSFLAGSTGLSRGSKN